MRVLHLVKTSDGAAWAAAQAAVLARAGVEVHAALPASEGRMMPEWQASGAALHIVDCDMPLRRPHLLAGRRRALRELVEKVAPDIIHSHFVGTTMLLRMALGRKHPTPRIFQVPGPLHMEHPVTRRAEMALAGPADRWIGSSDFICSLYRRAGVADDRLFLSYYGAKLPAPNERTGALRRRLGIPDDAFVAGSVNWIYPPKRWLGQRVGLKGHEDVIDALGLAMAEEPRLHGVLVGGVFGRDPGGKHFARLRRRAEEVGRGRIHMPGPIRPGEADDIWPDFDCCLHAPQSENCGGVIEPMLAGVPVAAARVGGLPEVVRDKATGLLTPPRSPSELARALIEIVRTPGLSAARAVRGRSLVRTMFDVERTAAEVLAVYRHLLEPDAPPPASFDVRSFLARRETEGA